MKFAIMKKILTYIILPLMIVHILLRFFSSVENVCDMDQNSFKKERTNAFKGANIVLQFVFFMLFYPEFCSIFYHRNGKIGKVLSIFCPPQRCLYIRASRENLGGGLVVKHGHSTEINARKIGVNCHIFQNVTIGTRGSSIGPTLGNNVFVGTGAVILGNISIGNNVRIGANATVVKDVPDNTTVVPAPNIFIPSSRAPR